MISRKSSYSSLEENIKEFKKYALSYFGEGGIDDIGASKEQIHRAMLKAFEYNLESGESDVQGLFSSDLSLVKDILLNEFNIKP